MFEGEWVPPTPFNGIAFLAAGAVLRHLHRRTQARGEPRARALNEKRHARLARPDRASVPDASPSNHPTATDPRHPPLPRLHRSSPTENGDLNPNGRGRRRDGQPRRGRRRRGDDTAGDDWDRDDVAGVSGGDLRDGSTAVEAASDVDRARHVERRRDTDQREDPVTRLAAESREAHLRRVAQQLAARDGPNPSEGATPFGAPPPLDPHPSVVGEILPEAPPEPDRSVLPEAPSVCAGTVSPATSTLLAAESLSETARSQIAFFRRLSLDGGRRTEGDDEGAGLDEGASLEEGATEEGAVPGTPPPNDPEPSNDHEPPNDPKPPNDPVVVADDPEQRTCRFCLGGEEEGATGDGVLIAPCRCAGTQRWVHAGCLREWQRVSVSSAGRVERRCRVCRHAFRLPRPPIKDALTQWFNPTATDRLQCYRRAWWQMLSNSIMAQEGVEHIGTANQLARLFLATELRVWGGREVRGERSASRVGESREAVHKRAQRRSARVAGFHRRGARRRTHRASDEFSLPFAPYAARRRRSRGWRRERGEAPRGRHLPSQARRGWSAGLDRSPRGSGHDASDAAGGSRPGGHLLLREVPAVQGDVRSPRRGWARW